MRLFPIVIGPETELLLCYYYASIVYTHLRLFTHFDEKQHDSVLPNRMDGFAFCTFQSASTRGESCYAYMQRSANSLTIVLGILKLIEMQV